MKPRCICHQPVEPTQARTLCSRCGATIERAGDDWVERKPMHFVPEQNWSWTKTADPYKRRTRGR